MLSTKPIEQIEEIFHYTPLAIQSIDTTRKWALFLALVGIVVTVFVFIAGLLITLVVSVSENFLLQNESPVISPIVVFFTLVVCAIYFIPLYYLMKFSLESKNAIATRNAEQLGNALRYLKNYFQFIGITMIVIIVFNILFFTAVLFVSLLNININ